MTTSPYRIAYFGRILPVLSETFVVREIAALRHLGAWVKPFSLYPPDLAAIHPEAPELSREVEVLWQPARPLFWLAHLCFLLRQPRRYLHCLLHYGLLAPEPWRGRRRGLAFFLMAPYAAWRCPRPIWPASPSASRCTPMTSSSTSCCCRPSSPPRPL